MSGATTSRPNSAVCGSAGERCKRTGGHEKRRSHRATRATSAEVSSLTNSSRTASTGAGSHRRGPAPPSHTQPSATSAAHPHPQPTASQRIPCVATIPAPPDRTQLASARAVETNNGHPAAAGPAGRVARVCGATISWWTSTASPTSSTWSPRPTSSPPDAPRWRAPRTRATRRWRRSWGALRKPTTTGRALNVLVRAEPAGVDQLLDLGAALRSAQQALRGDELRSLATRRAAILSALTERAAAAVRERDHELSEAVLREVSQSLSAALADPEIGADLRRGRMLGAVSYSGFGPAALVSVPMPPRSGGEVARRRAPGTRRDRRRRPAESARRGVAQGAGGGRRGGTRCAQDRVRPPRGNRAGGGSPTQDRGAPGRTDAGGAGAPVRRLHAPRGRGDCPARCR